MEQSRGNPERDSDLSPPLGALYETAPDVIERLQDINDKDPAFVSWVLVRSDELMRLLQGAGGTAGIDIKEAIALSLIEAYDIHMAKVAREHIARMLEG